MTVHINGTYTHLAFSNAPEKSSGCWQINNSSEDIWIIWKDADAAQIPKNVDQQLVTIVTNINLKIVTILH